MVREAKPDMGTQVLGSEWVGGYVRPCFGRLAETLAPKLRAGSMHVRMLTQTVLAYLYHFIHGHASGAGGGRSAIQRAGKDIATAGGGGGGGRGAKDGHGGGGGGLVGNDGDDPQGNGGAGGSQTAKGAGGKAEGDQYQGSYSTNAFCGGGGGGFYGGGACKVSSFVFAPNIRCIVRVHSSDNIANARLIPRMP